MYYTYIVYIDLITVLQVWIEGRRVLQRQGLLCSRRGNGSRDCRVGRKQQCIADKCSLRWSVSVEQYHMASRESRTTQRRF